MKYVVVLGFTTSEWKPVGEVVLSLLYGCLLGEIGGMETPQRWCHEVTIIVQGQELFHPTR